MFFIELTCRIVAAIMLVAAVPDWVQFGGKLRRGWTVSFAVLDVEDLEKKLKEIHESKQV